MSNGYFKIRLVRVSQQTGKINQNQPKTPQQQQQHRELSVGGGVGGGTTVNLD